MKSKFLLFMLTAGFLMQSYHASSQWQFVGGQGFNGGEVRYTSLAIGAGSSPILAFRDDALSAGKLTVKKYSGSTWTNMGTPGFSPGPVSEVSLTTDSATGSPYVAFIDSIAGVTVAHYTGTSWGYLGAPGFISSQCSNLSLVIAGDGTPYLGYISDLGSTSMVKYSGGTWSQVGSVNFSADGPSNVGFAIDHHGTPYAISRLDNVMNSKVQVQKYNGSSWVNVGNVGFDSAYGYKVSIAFSPANQIGVALSSSIAPNPGHVWTYTGASWLRLGGDIWTAGVDEVSLTTTPQGVPVVAFNDLGNLRYQGMAAYYQSNTWHVIGGTTISGHGAPYLSLAVNSGGYVYVGYADEEVNYAATVAKYSYLTGINETSTAAEFNVYPNPNTGKFMISFKAIPEGETQLTVVNMLGQTVWQDSKVISTNSESVTLSDIARGLYALQVKTGTGTETRLIEIQ